MRIEEPKPMKEIHEIQEQIYEEIKDLSPTERVERSNKVAREFMKKHNLNLEIVSKH